MAWNSSDFRSPFGKITDITIRRFLFAFFGDFVPHHTRVPAWRFYIADNAKFSGSTIAACRQIIPDLARDPRMPQNRNFASPAAILTAILISTS
jgi:hypothetical protein